MFGIGAGELLVLLVLAMIFVGPQKLPEMGRTIGRSLNEFKSYTNEMKSVLAIDQVPVTTLTKVVNKSLTAEDMVNMMTRQPEVPAAQNTTSDTATTETISTTSTTDAVGNTQAATKN